MCNGNSQSLQRNRWEIEIYLTLVGKVVLTNIQNTKCEILCKTTTNTSGGHSSSTRSVSAYFKANIILQTGF